MLAGRRVYTADSFLVSDGSLRTFGGAYGEQDLRDTFSTMSTGVLKDLLYKCVLQYIDDTMIYVKTEEELLDNLELYFDVMLKYNIKLHPGKFVLYETEIEWGGKLLSSNGL